MLNNTPHSNIPECSLAPPTITIANAALVGYDDTFLQYSPSWSGTLTVECTTNSLLPSGGSSQYISCVDTGWDTTALVDCVPGKSKI